MVHAAASIAVRDGLVEGAGMDLDPRRQRTWIRMAVIPLMIVSYVVAVLYKGSLVYMLLTAYGAVVQFMPVVLATLYWRRATAPGVLSGLLAGFGMTTLFVMQPDLRPFPIHAGIYGLTVNVVLLVAVSLSTRSSAPERDREFLEVAASRSGS